MKLHALVFQKVCLSCRCTLGWWPSWMPQYPWRTHLPQMEWMVCTAMKPCLRSNRYFLCSFILPDLTPVHSTDIMSCSCQQSAWCICSPAYQQQSLCQFSTVSGIMLVLRLRCMNEGVLKIIVLRRLWGKVTSCEYLVAATDTKQPPTKLRLHSLHLLILWQHMGGMTSTLLR